ncbi:MAG: hypothetical protein GXX85_10805 [Ignavibacteria bacterium]|nr:hypothetical protein [Ignavibacteria bacterium]
MNRKLKNTLIFLGLLILALVIGLIPIYLQGQKIDDKEKELEQYRRQEYNTDELTLQLEQLKVEFSKLDSILSSRKFNIPVNLSQSRFYDFITKVSFNFSPQSYVNQEFVSVEKKEHFSIYNYRLTGVAYFNDVYKLLYAIEQSKELKKVSSVSLANYVKVDDEGIPYYLVNFSLDIQVLNSDNDRFASSNFKENKLVPNQIYDVFYPQIRNEIPPNVDNLLDVQSAQLLALIPDGAFLADAKGNTYLLWDGDEVYLGHLTDIDYDRNQVNFILNKGGIIERVSLKLENKQLEKTNKKK